MLESIKAHPYVAGGAVIGGLLLVYLLSGSGGGTSVSTPSPTDPTAAGTDFQAQSLAAGVQTTQINAALDAAKTADATNITLAGIDAQSKFDIAQLSGGIAMAQINAAQAVTQQTNALTAQVQEQQIAAGVTANQNATDVQKQLISLNAQTQQQQIKATNHPIIDLIGNVLSHIL